MGEDSVRNLNALEIAMDEFLPLLLTRTMELFRAIDGDSSKSSHGYAGQIENARNLSLTSMCEALSTSMNDEQRKACLKQLLPDVLSNPCRGGKREGISLTWGSTMFLSFLGRLTNEHPSSTVGYLMPFIRSKIDLIGDKPEEEIQQMVWYNHVLSIMMRYSDAATIGLHSDLVNKCIALCSKAKSSTLFKSAMSLLRNYIGALAGDRPLAVAPTSVWGQETAHQELNMQWYTPNDQAKELLESLFATHLDTSVVALEQLCQIDASKEDDDATQVWKRTLATLCRTLEGLMTVAVGNGTEGLGLTAVRMERLCAASKVAVLYLSKRGATSDVSHLKKLIKLVQYLTLLPTSYTSAGRDNTVTFLLHGSFGDNYIERVEREQLEIQGSTGANGADAVNDYNPLDVVMKSPSWLMSRRIQQLHCQKIDNTGFMKCLMDDDYLRVQSMTALNLFMTLSQHTYPIVRLRAQSAYQTILNRRSSYHYDVIDALIQEIEKKDITITARIGIVTLLHQPGFLARLWLNRSQLERVVLALTVGSLTQTTEDKDDKDSEKEDDVKKTELRTLTRSLLVALLRTRDHQPAEGIADAKDLSLLLNRQLGWREELVLLSFEFFSKRSSHSKLMNYLVQLLTEREGTTPLPLVRLATNMLAALCSSNRCTEDVVTVGKTLLSTQQRVKDTTGKSNTVLSRLMEALEGKHPRSSGGRAQWSAGVKEMLDETRRNVSVGNGGYSKWVPHALSAKSIGQVDVSNVSIIRLLNLTINDLEQLIQEYAGSSSSTESTTSTTTTTGSTGSTDIVLEEASSSNSNDETNERSRRCTAIEMWLGTLLNLLDDAPESFAANWSSTFGPILINGINTSSPTGKRDWCHVLRLVTSKLSSSNDLTMLSTFVSTVTTEMITFTTDSNETNSTSTNSSKQHAAWLNVLTCVVEEMEMCVRGGVIRDISTLSTLIPVNANLLTVMIQSARHPISMCRSAAAQCLAMLHLYSLAISPSAASTSTTSGSDSLSGPLNAILQLAASDKEDNHGVETTLGVLTSMIIVHSNMRYTPLASPSLSLLLTLMETALRHQNLSQSGKDGELAAVAVGTLTMLRGSLHASTLEDIAMIHASLEKVQKESDNWHTRKQIPQVLMSIYMRHLSLYDSNATATLERLLLIGLKDKKSVEVQDASSAALTMYLMTKGNNETEKDAIMTTNYVTVFNELLSIKIPRPHPSTEKDEEKIKKRTRTIRNRTIKQRAGMLGLCAVVNAYPYRVPSFVPEILVSVARVIGSSKGTLKTTLFSDFKKSKEDGWIFHKRAFSSDQYEFLSEYFLGGNYYA